MKKFCCVCLIVIMLTSMSVFTVSAAGETTFTIQSYPSGWDNSVKIQDTIAGAVFTAKPIYSAGTKATQYRYQWKVQAGDIYRNIPWECGVKNWDETAVHIVSTAEKLSETIGVEITPLDQNGKPTGLAVFENYVGNVMAIKTNKTNYAGDFGVTEEAWGQHQQTPAQYKFKVKGNNTEFILLDCSAYDGAYYVMMEEGVEKRAFGATNKLEPTVETSVSYWLNNDFLNGATLPQKIKDNLSVNREWRVEGRATWPGIWDAYTINASVNMLSLTEFLKYKGQFGLKLNSYTDGVDNEAWWLSTSSGENRALSSMQYGWWHDGKPSSGSYGVTGAIGDRPIDGRTDDDSTLIQWVRPTFYLNHDFFKKVALDVTSLGSRVKQELLNNCTTSELQALYTKDELEQIDPKFQFDYEIKNMTIDKTKGFDVGFDMTCNGANSGNEKAYIVIYNGDQLINIKIIPLTLTTGNSQHYSVSFSGISTFTEVKIFCMNDTNMQPKASVLTSEGAIIIDNINKDVKLIETALPSVLYGVKGREMNVYFNDVTISNNPQNFQIDVQCDKGIQQEERWTYTPAEAGTFNLTINALHNGDVLLDTKTIMVKTMDTAGSGVNKNVLFIGDDWTNNGTYLSGVADRFSKDGDNITFVGTNGETIKHEGAKGRTTASLCKSATNNPFYNNTTKAFDFQYYLDNSHVVKPEVVVLFLGINDVIEGIDNTETINNLNNIINNIHSVDSNIKIGVVLTPAPAENQDGFANDFTTKNTASMHKYNAYRLMQEQIKTFDNKLSNVFVIPVNTNVDSRYGYDFENVNPNIYVTNSTISRQSGNIMANNAGFQQCADSIYAALKFLY